jgi:electron-transferring-flavoprotein dehydrogenase
MAKGLWTGTLMFGIDQVLLRGKAPWTLHNTADHLKLKPAAECTPIAYPKPDGVLTFDRLSSVFLSNTNHEEDQPCHLQLKDAGCRSRPTSRSTTRPSSATARPGCMRSCATNERRQSALQINAQNCVHCKTCDIKDPTQNINWVVPQGGEGPIYTQM